MKKWIYDFCNDLRVIWSNFKQEINEANKDTPEGTRIDDFNSRMGTPQDLNPSYDLRKVSAIVDIYHLRDRK